MDAVFEFWATKDKACIQAYVSPYIYKQTQWPLGSGHAKHIIYLSPLIAEKLALKSIIAQV